MPPAPSGAVPKIWHGLAQVFAQKGHTVTVLCRGHESQTRDEIIAGVCYVRRMRWNRSGTLYWDLCKDLLYAGTMSALLPEADICVCNTFWLPLLVSTFRRGRGKLVVAVHRYPKGQMGLYRKCDRLTTVSNAVRDAIVTQTPHVAHRVNVIHNPIDTRVFQPPSCGRSFSTAGNVVYTGRVHPEKGVHLLIGAFAIVHSRFPQLSLRIVGPVDRSQGGGGNEYLRQLMARAKNLPVAFLGSLNKPSGLAQLLQESHYYCYPSLADRGESFGVAPLEAMATGLPTIVSNLDCFKDFVKHEQTGVIFDHHSPDPTGALAATLQRLIADQALASAISRTGAEKAREYSYERVADQYLEDWYSLIGAKRLPLKEGRRA